MANSCDAFAQLVAHQISQIHSNLDISLGTYQVEMSEAPSSPCSISLWHPCIMLTYAYDINMLMTPSYLSISPEGAISYLGFLPASHGQMAEGEQTEIESSQDGGDIGGLNILLSFFF